MGETQGRPLQEYFSDPASWRKRLMVGHEARGWRMLREGTMAYMSFGDGSRELYDLASDPYQLESLHRAPAREAEMAGYSEHLAALSAATSGDATRAAEA